MRAVISEVEFNEVALSYDDNISGRRVEMVIRAPRLGGYVRDGAGHELCYELASTGNTLHWSGNYPLINLVRREYRAMRRAEKRYLRQFAV